MYFKPSAWNEKKYNFFNTAGFWVLQKNHNIT